MIPAFECLVVMCKREAISMVDPDSLLIHAIGRGDHQAFEILVKKYQSPLLNFITRYIGDQSMAEDITQEVFLRIYHAAPRFQAKTKVSTWIFHIAYNQALTETGRRKKCRNLWQALYQRREEAAEEPLAEPLERYEQTEEIMAMLGRLPENQKAAMLLHINENLSYREIADVLEVSVQQEFLRGFREVDILVHALPKIDPSADFASRVVSAAIRTSK
jgi:RNA polymerase sigma-70 factor, ECF subfamily